MDYRVTDTELTQIADAIRAKGNTDKPLKFPSGFVNAIKAIVPGGGGLTGYGEAIFDGASFFDVITAYKNTARKE